MNRIVNVYLEFAELQAIERKPMYMADWIRKLDDFLRMSDREILSHKGLISSEDAKKKAEQEYEKYAERTRNELSRVEQHFIESIDNTMKQLKKRG